MNQESLENKKDIFEEAKEYLIEKLGEHTKSLDAFLASNKKDTIERVKFQIEEKKKNIKEEYLQKLKTIESNKNLGEVVLRPMIDKAKRDLEKGFVWLDNLLKSFE